MNYHIIFKTVGTLILLVALAMVICFVLGWLLPVAETRLPEIALWGWGMAVGTTVGSGVALLLMGRIAKGKRDAAVMLRKEAVAIVGLGWIACSFHVALPYVYCEPGLMPDKAFFEAVSGLTTTGASVFTDLAALPKTVLLWRSATQWMGGIGILAMFVLVLAGTGASGRTFFAAESSLQSSDLALANVRRTTRALWGVYVGLTVVCGLGLWALGMTPFQAINHALATTSTGGFGTENDSIAGAAFHDGIKIWMTVFMLGGAISFPLYIVVIRRRQFTFLKEHEETWWFLGIAGGAAVAIILILGNAGVEESWVNIVFTVVSMVTTTGFVVCDYDKWPVMAKELILLLMVVGGCSGSTAGGLKVSRFILWLRFVRAELTRVFRPKVVRNLNLNGKPVPVGARGQLFLVLSMAAFFVAMGSLAMRILEPGMSTEGCVSAVVTSLANVGPAFAEVGPTQNFAQLSGASTVMLALLMMVGRLEYVAVLVLFSRGLWRRY